MLFINEWFPNPAGNDSAGEFVELYNNESMTVSLNGYALGGGGKKNFSLAGYSVPPDGYLVLKKTQTKLALKNMDGRLLLYNPSGRIVDQSSFLGAAPEGKSYNRVNYGIDGSEHFAFGNPTPGGVNDAALQIGVTKEHHAYNIPINQITINSIQFLSLLVGATALITGLIIYTLQQNENISKLFFERD